MRNQFKSRLTPRTILGSGLSTYPTLRWSALQPVAHIMNLYTNDVYLSNFAFHWAIKGNLPFKSLDQCPPSGKAKIVGPLIELIVSYIKLDLLALLLVCAVLFRTYLIVRRKVAPSLLWDGLAFGGAACFLGYLGLSISADAKHYSAPIDLIGLLYLAHLTSLSEAKLHFWRKLAALALLLAIVILDIIHGLVVRPYPYLRVGQV